MGKKTILTPKQRDFLELVQKEPYITEKFYLTGGTALSAFYFQHRESHDIDLFSEKEVNPQWIMAFLKKVGKKLGVQKISGQNFLGLYTYTLTYGDGAMLKVDFNYYPFPPIEKGAMFGRLTVSSVYDIAVNKIHTIGMKPRARDYVDVYVIFQNSHEEPLRYLERMRLDSQAKFDWPLEAKNLAVAFTRVKDIPEGELPRMFIAFEKKKMEEFFLSLAKGLEKEIFMP